MFAKLGEKIKAEWIRPLIMESFIYSQQYGVGGVCATVGLLWWNLQTSKKQYERILSYQAEIEKWNKKIDDRSRKIILNCESIKRAMLVQAYRDSGKEHGDKSSTRAYEVFLDLLGKESQDKKGELLVLAVDEYKEDKEEEEEEEEKVGGGNEQFDGIVAFFKRWFPLPWENRNQAPPQLDVIYASSLSYDMSKYFPLVDPSLPHSMVKQIEYYFSDANLVKDDSLMSKMDEEGWVPIELIADFPGVKKFIDSAQVTDAVQFILYFLRASTLVEVQDKKTE